MLDHFFGLQRHNIHFADNSLQQPEGTEGYDPLFKIRDALDTVGNTCGTQVNQINVPAIGSVWGWSPRHLVGCVIESRSLLNWLLRIEKRGAKHLRWGVLYAKIQYAKSAGKRGTIDMSKNPTFYPTSKPSTPSCRGTINSTIMVQLTWFKVHNALPRHQWPCLHFESCQTDHYWGRYVWLKSKCILSEYSNRKGCSLSPSARTVSPKNKTVLRVLELEGHASLAID